MISTKNPRPSPANFRAATLSDALVARRLVLQLPLASLVGCARSMSRPAPDLAPAPLAFRRRFLDVLDELELVRLYALNPNGPSRSEAPPDATYFRGYLVSRDAAPAAPDSHQGRAHRGLRNIIEATSAVAAACFDPAQGATFTGNAGTFDALVCFGCNNYRIYGQSKVDVVGDSFEAADARPWFQAFQAAGLIERRAPS